MLKTADTIFDNKLFLAGVIVGILYGLAIRFWVKLFPQSHRMGLVSKSEYNTDLESILHN